MNQHIAFIGGGNMANAIMSGMLRSGISAQAIDVIEPFEAIRTSLESQFGVGTHAKADNFLKRANLVVWAVKPQVLREATAQVSIHTQNALHLSVVAGIRSDSLAAWLGNERIVRSMPNTPALIGKGITGLYARPAVDAQSRQTAQNLVTTMGDFLWLEKEEQLDAVTALSGSGPAYMFYFMEAMTSAGASLGLTQQQAYKLAIATCIGAGELAKTSPDTAEVLRQRVTSKGGTTYAAISSMEFDGMKALFIKAMSAAHRRAGELGDEFGAA